VYGCDTLQLKELSMNRLDDSEVTEFARAHVQEQVTLWTGRLSALNGRPAVTRRRRAVVGGPEAPRKRNFSPEARKKMSEMMKARWAARRAKKAAAKKPAKPSKKVVVKPAKRGRGRPKKTAVAAMGGE
jgi:hypothetical protein